ncbi:uncharacterized protein [Magallana gigas]|uniref:uncharacterized protein n=1 Tax=Magallana gigas TaxID=29159 RepID=UPI003342CAE2
MASSRDIESQGIGLHARHGVPEPEFPDIQEPEPALPQKRFVHIYTVTRILCGLLILTNTAMDWVLYSELNSDCEDIKKRYLVVTIIGTILTIAQICNIVYQVKANYIEDNKFQEPLNYLDGRTEAMLMVLLVELPQLLLLQDYSKSPCDKAKHCSKTSSTSSTNGDSGRSLFPLFPWFRPLTTTTTTTTTLPPNTDNTFDIQFLTACAVVGLVSCHFRFHLSRPLPRFGRRGVADEYKMLKLQETRVLKCIICFDNILPRILQFVELDCLCIFRKFKIPMVFGDCLCDHLTPIWRWSYFVLECWVCRFTYCPKRERGEVWLVNRMRMLRRRPGFLCLNKEDPYFLGVYFPYFFILTVCVFLSLMGTYNCSIPFSGKMRPVSDTVRFVYGFIILNKI